DVRRVDAVREAVLLAVADRVLTPGLEQGSHDPVLTLDLDAPRAPRRHEAVENSLHLVRRSVARRPEPERRGRLVPDRPQPSLRGILRRLVAGQDVGAEDIAAEGGVGRRLLASLAVVHMEGAHGVPEL